MVQVRNGASLFMGCKGRVSQDYASWQMRIHSLEECSSSSCRETRDAAAGLHMWSRKWLALFITQQLFFPSGKED